MKRKTVDDYRQEIIGNTYGWLTVLDVMPNPAGGHMVCSCICKCGNTCVKQLRKVIHGHTSSCGCYNSSTEKGQKHSKYFKEHPESIASMIANLKEWRKNNPEKVADISVKISKWYTDHPEFLHYSKMEQSVYEYILSIYNGTCIRNSRDIISPNELDLYYPEKRIAVEFNGDFWHNVDHRGCQYHSNKYLKCKHNSILLVSIFESEWLTNRDAIEKYLVDLFNNKSNQLSYTVDGYMNNNYPAPNVTTDDCIVSNFYNSKNSIVYTCGYSKII